jgi:hypothetical protein
VRGGAGGERRVRLIASCLRVSLVRV